ncbi:unnamed protein product [Phytophthora fragariaefolia]|uniref:Unnamed protein product n=1 Tax=Phytophthora fragariaefolia TaxID=1490495 RepID=A0A9W6U1V0_9STRA|nr:unnamed protein product [Phytophthora fragariaefolia]
MFTCFDGPSYGIKTWPRLTSVLRATSPHAGNDSTGSMNDDAESDQLQTPDDPSAESVAEESEFEPDGSGDGDSGVNARSNELLADKDDNLNVIDDEGDAAEYGVMDSGDDAEKDDLDVGEDQDESINAHASDDDEAAATEEEICAEMHFAQSFLDRFGGESQIIAGNLKTEVLRSMAAEGWEDVVEPDTHDYPMTPYEPVNNTSSYPGLRHGYSGPTPDALRNAESPLALFFFFMLVALCQHIAVCSNQYGREMIHLRIDEQYKHYCSKRRYNPDLPRKTKHDIKNELEGTKKHFASRPLSFCWVAYRTNNRSQSRKASPPLEDN